MTDTQKIVAKTKEYILNLYSDGYSTHQNMILGLKNGIDFFVGENRDNIETIKDEIISTCLKEFELRTRVYYKVGHLKKIESIKSNFETFVRDLNPNDIVEIHATPFERRIKLEESERLTRLLKEKFDFDSWRDHNYYWEPLSKSKNKVSLIHFEDEIFGKNEIDTIVSIIQSISSNKVYFLTEEQIIYEVEASELNFNCIESSYCDFKINWLIYISHEGIITFSGQQLVTEIENLFPDIIKYKNQFK